MMGLFYLSTRPGCCPAFFLFHEPVKNMFIAYELLVNKQRLTDRKSKHVHKHTLINDSYDSLLTDDSIINRYISIISLCFKHLNNLYEYESLNT